MQMGRTSHPIHVGTLYDSTYTAFDGVGRRTPQDVGQVVTQRCFEQMNKSHFAGLNETDCDLSRIYLLQSLLVIVTAGCGLSLTWMNLGNLKVGVL